MPKVIILHRFIIFSGIIIIIIFCTSSVIVSLLSSGISIVSRASFLLWLFSPHRHCLFYISISILVIVFHIIIILTFVALSLFPHYHFWVTYFLPILYSVSHFSISINIFSIITLTSSLSSYFHDHYPFIITFSSPVSHRQSYFQVFSHHFLLHHLHHHHPSHHFLHHHNIEGKKVKALLTSQLNLNTNKQTNLSKHCVTHSRPAHTRTRRLTHVRMCVCVCIHSTQVTCSSLQPG